VVIRDLCADDRDRPLTSTNRTSTCFDTLAGASRILAASSRADAALLPATGLIASPLFSGATAAPWRFGEGAVVPRHLT
jgi:hypothetical protein